MSEEAVRKILRDFGLTEKEADIYIFLAKHGILKGGEVARQTKTPKALVYRILKSLQAQGIVESTLEFPARFTAAPFEAIIDLNVKSKLNEIARLKGEKTALINHWKQIENAPSISPVEKFSVIEGKQKVYQKLSQLIMQTKTNLSCIITSKELAQANYFGIFDQDSKKQSSKRSFRFLIELSNQNLKDAKELVKDIERKVPNAEVRIPELGSNLFPQMIIQDKEETMFRISPKVDNCFDKWDVSLWTNCKSLIGAFSVVFDGLWHNSTEAQTKISELQTGVSLTQKMEVINDSEDSKRKFCEVLRSAGKEIIMVTSSGDPLEIDKIRQLLNECAQKSVSVKLMVPITCENKDLAQELSKQYEVRHVPVGYLDTALVDGRHLFQFRTTILKSEQVFVKTFYTNDSEYVSKTKKMLTDTWEHAQIPSTTTLETILQEVDPQLSPFPRCPPNYMGTPFIVEEKPVGTLTEKDILNKMISAKYSDATSLDVIDRRYGSIGLAVIHPPDYLKLPDIMIVINKIEKQSNLGEEDAIIFLSWLKTQKGFAYVPVAIIGDNPKAHEFWKNMNASTPAGKNTHLLEKDEIEIRLHGNSLFAGWTIPIPLFPAQQTIPPACLLIEGYGDIKTTAYTVAPPSGHRILREENYLDAFVTFFHPSSKYSGPGTDGYLIRDSIITIFSPTNFPSKNSIN